MNPALILGLLDLAIRGGVAVANLQAQKAVFAQITAEGREPTPAELQSLSETVDAAMEDLGDLV